MVLCVKETKTHEVQCHKRRSRQAVAIVSVRPVTLGTRATVSPLPPVYCVDLTFMYLGYEGHCQCFRLCMSVTPGVKLIHQVESLVKNGPFLNGVFTKVLQEAHNVY